MAVPLGDVLVYLRGDDKDLKKTLDHAESETKSTAGNIANLAKNVAVGVGTAAIGALGALTGVAIAGIDAASDLGESLSKTKVVFGDAADEIEAWSETTATALGQSQQQALEAVGTFGNLFDAMGIGTDASKEMSINLVELASDLASFNNIDPTEALEKLRAGLVGETEPLRTLGVNLNAAAIEAKALEMGLAEVVVSELDLSKATIAVEKAAQNLAKAQAEHGAQSLQAAEANNKYNEAINKLVKAQQGETQELTAAQKAQAAYALILEQTTNAQGDFERTAGGLANQQRILTAQWENMKATLGTALLPVVTEVMKAFNQFLTDVMPKLKDYIENTLIPAIGRLKTAWDEDWGGMRTTITEFTNAVPVALGEMWRVIDEIMGKETEETKSGWEGFWGGLTSFFTSFVLVTISSWTEGLLSLQSLYGAWAALFRGDWEGYWSGLYDFYEHTFNQILNWTEFFFGPELRNKIVNALNGVNDALRNWSETLMGWWNNLFSGLPGLGGFGSLPTLPTVPNLGIVNPGNVTNNSPITINVNGGADGYDTGREIGNGLLDVMRYRGG